MCAKRTISPEGERDHVAALANGLRAVEAFSASRRRLSLSDVAKTAGLSRAAARRYLLTLVDVGYAEFDGKYFQLTPRVLRLGHAYLSSVSIPQIAQPFVDELGEMTEEAVAVAVLQGSDALIIASSQSRRIVGVFTRIGTQLPVFTSSTGRVLLARQNDEAVAHKLARSNSIEKFTGKTKTSPEEILAEIRHVRRSGFALNDEEIEVGLRVIAVPVRNSAGTTIAALCISTYSARFEIEQLQTKFLPVLKAASTRLTELIATHELGRNTIWTGSKKVLPRG